MSKFIQYLAVKAATRMRSFIASTNSSQVTAWALFQQESKYSTYLPLVCSSIGKHTDHSWFARLETVKFALPIIATLPTHTLLACWIPNGLPIFTFLPMVSVALTAFSSNFCHL